MNLTPNTLALCDGMSRTLASKDVLLGPLERWCVCRVDQPMKINVVVKVGRGDQYIGGPPRFLSGGTYPPVPPPVATPLYITM